MDSKPLGWISVIKTKGMSLWAIGGWCQVPVHTEPGWVPQFEGRSVSCWAKLEVCSAPHPPTWSWRENLGAPLPWTTPQKDPGRAAPFPLAVPGWGGGWPKFRLPRKPGWEIFKKKKQGNPLVIQRLGFCSHCQGPGFNLVGESHQPHGTPVNKREKNKAKRVRLPWGIQNSSHGHCGQKSSPGPYSVWREWKCDLIF